MSLENLAGTFLRRFDLFGQAEDLGKAISFSRETLELQPAPHPGRFISLNNLGSALEKRYRHSGQQVDLNEAILCHQDALELLPPAHPFRSASLNNCAVSLATRYNQTGQHKDLDAALSAHYQSLDALVSGNSDICGFSANLGRTFLYSYFRTHESEYLNKAIAAFRVAVTCEVAPTSVRFGAAKEWARHADSKHESALEAYQAAVQLLPRLAMLYLDLESRQQALISGSDGLARDAAACAIRLGQYDKAIELLEEGRAVFWSQALQLRTPMTNLHDAAPELGAKLRRISIALERGSLRDALKSRSDASQKVMSMEQESSRLRRLNDDWLATLEEVRCLDTFGDFLRPNRIFSLQHAAANGPIVVLNASKTRCDALILKSTGVHYVPFPNLGLVEVSFLVKLIRYATAEDSRDTFFLKSNPAHVEGLVQQMPFISDTLRLLRLPLERHVKRVSDISEYRNDIFRYVLGVLWEAVAKPVIQSLDLMVISFL
jgi:tetratricopeptide (TPR) repeat protein